MAAKGVCEFNDKEEDITCYLQQLKHFFISREVKDEHKVSWLITQVGPKVYQTLRDLTFPEDPADKTFSQLSDILIHHYSPKRIQGAERCRFHQRKQQPGESLPDYALALRHLASTCGFGQFLDDSLRDQFINGLASEVLREKLITETVDFTQTVAKACLFEKSSEFSRLTTGNGASHINQVRHNKKGRLNQAATHKRNAEGRPPTTRGACYGCGNKTHIRPNCPHKNSKCHECGKIGHIARVCQTKRHGGRTVKQVESLRERPNDEWDLKQVTIKDASPWMVDITVEGTSIQMEIDTAASESVVGETLLKEHWPHLRAQLEKSSPLKSCTGQEIPLLGRAQVKVEYRGNTMELPLVFAKGPFPALCGRPWLRMMQMNWKGMIAEVREPPDEVATVVDELTAQFASVFTEKGTEIKGFEANIHLTEGAIPIFRRARPVPFPLLTKVEKELEHMESQGILKKVPTSRWATPIVVVPKQNGEVRICGDYRLTVNRYLEAQQCALPLIDDLSTVEGKWFCVLDLERAYLQLKLGQESQHLLTLNTHKGLYQCLRLPYGISTAPAIFQGVMSQMLEGIDGLFIYLDDVLIAGNTRMQCLQRLEAVLARFAEHGVRLRKEKCTFLAPKAHYLGFVLDQQGLHPDPEKVKAIQEAKIPTTVTELRAFLGLVNFYAKFVPHLATRLRPLYDLLGEGVPWTWGTTQQEAFATCVDTLSGGEVLTPYSLDRPVRLTADASAVGAGAVLAHIMPDGTEKPIAFTSKTFSAAERRYSQIEREAAALIHGVTKFHKYLWGRRFELVTDHKPLVTVFGPKTGVPALAAARLQRWALLLGAYQYDVKYKKGTDIAHADALSRLPMADSQEIELPINQVSVGDELPISCHEIADETKSDPILSKVLNYTRHGWPEENPAREYESYFRRREQLSIEGDCVLWGNRVVIPNKLRKNLLHLLHEQHPGMTRMKNLARGYVWWPDMDQEIEDMVRQCVTCQINQGAAPAVSPTPWTWPKRKWQRIYIDFAHMVGSTFLICVDGHSKWPEVRVMSKTDAYNVNSVLRTMFATWGLPEEVVSDNGPPFSSREFATFLQQNGVRHVRSPTYHPSSNGTAERGVQTFKTALQKQIKDPLTTGRSLQHQIDAFLFSYRNTPHTATAVSPAELFLGRRPRTRLSLVNPTTAISRRVEKAQEKVIASHFARRRDFEVGDQVWVQSMCHRKSFWEPGIITGKVSTVSYMVRVRDQSRQCHADHLRRRLITEYEPEEPRRRDPTVQLLPETEIRDTEIETGNRELRTTSAVVSTDTPRKTAEVLEPTEEVSEQSRKTEHKRTEPADNVLPRRSGRTRRPPQRLNL